MNQSVLLTLLPWVSLAAQSPAAQPPRPNIIFFLVDDMGWMDSTPYGSRYYETPSMERLARSGMRFTQTYAQPLCSPTRASILTGQYSARHGITSATGHLPPQPPGHSFLETQAPPGRPLLMPESKNYLEPSQYTLAEALHDAGYRTAHIGKWHLGLTQPHWPEAQGFEVAFHCHPDPGPPNNYFSPYGVVPQGSPNARQKVGTITDGPPGEYITDRLTDEAIRFIQSSDKRPFFLSLWHYGVHGPWGHKQAYTAEFAGKSDPSGRQGNPIMASMLKSIDESLGRILDTLESHHLTDNTILIFTSDNGGNVHSMTPEDAKLSKRKADDPQLLDWRKWAGDRPPTNNSPLRDGKGRLYEGGVRVPLIASWPSSIKAATTSDAIVGSVDFYPTILELAGVAAPEPSRQVLDGVSFAPVLRGSATSSRDSYFIYFPHLIPGASVRKGDWKLIRRFELRPDQYEGLHELFNLKDDPSETTNLAAKMPEKVKELDALIDDFLTKTNALQPKPNPAAAAAAVSPDPLQGLVPRSCTATLIEGSLHVEATGPSPFLGTAQIKRQGPLTLRLRARCRSGGPARVQWSTLDQAEFPKSGQSVDFNLPAGDQWQDLNVPLPIQGQPRIIRLYLPAQSSAVDIDSMSFFPENSANPIRSWNFDPVSP